MTEHRYWTAVETRDASFDGHFVLAVKTTGIYCRPSCPARTPKRQNVDFYDVPAAAEALIGSKVDDDALAAAGAACTEAASPISDKRGTVEYRRKVISVLCRRAGAIARDRAAARS